MVKDLVKKGYILVEYINEKLMFVNPLTEGLRCIVFKGHVDNMGVLRSFDILS